MGCCLSAGKGRAPPVSAASAEKFPPPIEEESVKEVVVQSVSVSTTVPAVPTAITAVPTTVTAVPTTVPAVPVPDLVSNAQTVLDSEPNLPPSLPTPEISQTKSDICSVSVSHSFSTATTATAASILEDDALSKPHRPPPPRRSRPDRVSRSPREQHSPQSKLRPRLTRERQQQLSQQNPNHNRRNIDSGSLPKSGLLDGPRRRSRSPATRGPSSARRSPMKKREVAPVKKEEVKVDVEVKKEEANVDGEIKKEDLAVKDPEVSMECFIFL